ncbi:ead/Ea22-like family protein [Salmonella enterica]|nr:ead/Ea22-like family protein [Salmonella enterica]
MRRMETPMTALNKQALREAAQEEIMLRSVSDTSDAWQDESSPEAVLALLDELEAKDKRIEEEICRANREHHRGFMMACNHLKEHANVHYADAAEMEIAALRQRIAELEAREVNLPAACADDEYFIDGVFQALRYERDVERAIRAAGIGVKGE